MQIKTEQIKKVLAIFLAGAFIIGPAAFGRTTAAAQQYYPGDRYGAYPPNPGYAPADPGYPSDRGYPPNQGYQPDQSYPPPPPDRGYAPPPPGPGYGDYRLSPEQLENLLAPVALYPDPILAQILVAATFVDQVQNAAGWMRRYNDPYGVDSQPWDISVKAIAHYPSVLFMMGERPDWTTALGQAYVEQPADVSAAIQHLRFMAQRAGNLVTNDYWEVVPTGGFIEILPIQPRFIYLPVYEPAVAFVSPVTFVFGPAFVIGPWLNCAWDWGGHRIFYHGWHGPRWVERSRPYVRLNNVYVNDRFRTVRVNRDVVRRTVNVENLNRFTSVHRDANFASLERRNNFVRDRNALTNDTLRRDRDRGRLDTQRNRPGTDRPATRDDRAARLRQERPTPSFQSPPTGRDERLRQGREDRNARPGQDRSPQNFRDSTRDERLRQQREDRSARLREDRQPGAPENPARRNRDNRGPAVENRQQPRERSQGFDDRAQQLREQNRQRFLENRPPQNFENRGPRNREERPQGPENPGERGRQEKSKQQVSAPPQTAPAPALGSAPRAERRVEAPGRGRVQAATPRAGQQNRTENARGAEKSRGQQEHPEIAG